MRLNFLNRYFSDTEVGVKLTLDGNQANKTMKEFRKEIKDANEELLNTSARFGSTSKEALTAAKRVAELNDAIKDANETAQLFDPGNKFQTIGNSVRGLVGGFTALQGGMALLGVEGENVQKTLLKVQAALALSEGLNVVADMKKDFVRLGAIIQQTTLFQKANNAATVVAAAVQRAFGVAVTQTSVGFKLLKGAIIATGIGALVVGIGFLVDKIMKWVNASSAAEMQQKRLAAANDIVSDSINRQIKELTALGGKDREIYKLKADQLNNEINLLYNKRDATGKIYGDDAKRYKDLITERKVLDIEETNRLKRQAEERARDAALKAGNANVKTGPNYDLESEIKGEMVRTESLKLLKRVQNTELNAIEKEGLDASLANINNNLKQKAYSEKQSYEASIALAEIEAREKIEFANSIGSALTSLSDLVGRQTAAGKVLGIAQATINTFIGASEVLRAKSTIPEPFGTISKIANVAAIIATGLSAVKNIAKTKVPGYSAGGGGGVSSVSVSAPIQPQAQVTNTQLNQNQLNQIGNATVRAFVIESDVSNNQERIRRLNRAARF